MNHKISFAALLIAGLAFLAGCRDDEKHPIIDFDFVGKGAYPRKVSVGSDVFDLRNIGSSKFEYSVEFVDLEKGNLVEAYEVYVKFTDKNAGNGDDSKAEKLWKTFGQGDFTTNAKGFRQVDVSVGATEILSLLGLDAAKISANDQFNFRTRVDFSTGTTHSAANSTAQVTGLSFNALFNANVVNTCPLNADEFTGDYQMSYDAVPAGAFGPIFGTTAPVVTLKAGTDKTKTERSFTIDYLPENAARKKSVTVKFQMLCDRLEMADVDCGDGCISGEKIILGQGAKTPITLTAPGTFQVNFDEFKKTGGCAGVTKAPITITFTKI